MDEASDREIPQAVVTCESRTRRMTVWCVNLLVIGALLGMLVAMGIAWWNSGSHGTLVTVQFPEGFGLKAEDEVRFRGIVVGKVVDVRLSDGMQSVTVQAILVPSAAALAREGTIFWVERPQISIRGVRSIDTMFSGKYLSVSPGPEDAPPVTTFVGEVEPPEILEPVEGGLSLALMSEDTYGLERGALVTYRGLNAGKVLGVHLDRSGNAIKTQIVIYPEFHEMVRDNTQFWIRSRVDFKIGLQGVDMDVDPAAALAPPVVAFATPSPAGEPIAPGQLFELSEHAMDGWREWKPWNRMSQALKDRFRDSDETVDEADDSDTENASSEKRGWLDRMRGLLD